MEGPTSRRSSLLPLIKGRWIMAVASLYILYCAGATYIFGIYSGAIKEELQYDQSTIGTLSFFKDLGANVGIVSGLMNEVLPSWSVLAVGAVMNLFGYVMIWLAVTHRIARPPTWQMYLYLCVGANSQTFANTGALVTVVKNFPQGRGEVLGIIKGCVGLSGAIFTQLYHAVYGNDRKAVILLIGWLPSLVTLLFMFFVRPIKPVYDKREKRNFYSFLYLALALAGFLMIALLVENQLHLPQVAYKAFGAVTMLLVIANIGIGIYAERSFAEQTQARAKDRNPMQELSVKSQRHANEQDAGGEHPSPSESTKAPIDSAPASAPARKPSDPSVHHDTPAQDSQQVSAEGSETSKPSASNSASTDTIEQTSDRNNLSKRASLIQRWHRFYKKWPQRGEDFTIPQAVFSTDMWILFLALTCGVGATLTAIDNMGQIGESQGYSQVSIDTCVSLISIWNFLGRVIAGFLSEILLRRYRFPRTLVLTVVLALACVGHLLIAFPGPATLYIASIVVGLCFGAQWPLMYAIISEIFGLKYYATLYNVGAISSPLGSYLLNVRVAGYLYDREARHQLDQPGGLVSGGAPAPSMQEQGELKCIGSQCFRLSFVIMTMVSAFASLVSAILVLRTRDFYRQNIYSKYKLQPDEQGIEHKADANAP